MSKLIGLVLVIMCALVSVSAQVRSDRRQYVEDKNASLRVEKISTTEENAFPRTSYSYPVEDFKPGVVQVGPRTTYLKEGLRTDEVVRLLGKPVTISERSDKGVVVAVYEFQRGEGQILVAEFENGLLVRSRTELRNERPVQADQ
ncbi:MAG TPA: hypothetical protein VGN90_03880 [Pyrinomonadaceae bacterium]|jgi:hypothetical protein|nr:hypothetical protein [Pyrinomonadaceae bacterium]